MMLQHLQPGQRFVLACDPAVNGTVLRKSDCSVTIKLSGGLRDVEFEDPRTGKKRSFCAESGRTTNWSLNTAVYPLCTPTQDPDDLTPASRTSDCGTSVGEAERDSFSKTTPTSTPASDVKGTDLSMTADTPADPTTGPTEYPAQPATKPAPAKRKRSEQPTTPKSKTGERSSKPGKRAKRIVSEVSRNSPKKKGKL